MFLLLIKKSSQDNKSEFKFLRSLLLDKKRSMFIDLTFHLWLAPIYALKIIFLMIVVELIIIFHSLNRTMIGLKVQKTGIPTPEPDKV